MIKRMHRLALDENEELMLLCDSIRNEPQEEWEPFFINSFELISKWKRVVLYAAIASLRESTLRFVLNNVHLKDLLFEEDFLNIAYYYEGESFVDILLEYGFVKT